MCWRETSKYADDYGNDDGGDEAGRIFWGGRRVGGQGDNKAEEMKRAAFSSIHPFS